MGARSLEDRREHRKEVFEAAAGSGSMKPDMRPLREVRRLTRTVASSGPGRRIQTAGGKEEEKWGEMRIAEMS